MRLYPALVHKEPRTDYGVSFPDFPGCVTAGSTPEEAYRMAIEALAFHIEGMSRDGDEIPPPCALAHALEAAKEDDGAVMLVPHQESD